MLAMNKKEFSKLPNGTVFMTTPPNSGFNDIMIKTGYHEVGGKPYWYSTVSFTPNAVQDKTKNNAYFTNWCGNDDSSSGYNDKDIFYVFSKAEVIAMINCLQWALGGCETPFNEDVWWWNLDNRPYTEEEVFDY